LRGSCRVARLPETRLRAIVVWRLIGFASLSVLNRQVKRQDPGAQEFDACATVHRALEGSQTIDMPFALAVAPARGQRICHGVDISPQRAKRCVA
jgi:hypothetical protein